ncbi:MAG TPA: ABC transporter permease [Stellaceae bacterium]|jgi:ABC-type nitrate/sulfonate/bicarbonate transport system permease component
MAVAVLPAASKEARRGLGPAGARLIAGAAILAVWEIVARLAAPDFVAKPSTIIAVIPSVLTSSGFLNATWVTLAATAEGLVAALILGTALGLLLGRSVIADRALRLWVNIFNAMPMIIALPLMSLWFGYTGAARFATIVFAAIFAVLINAAEGAQSVPKDYLEVAGSYRASRPRVLFEVVIPASMPYLLAGLRLAAGRALIGAVVAEFFLAIPGLGYFILFNSRTYHQNEAFVAVLLLAGFGVGCDVLISAATRRYLPWYRRDEKAD